MSFRRTRIIGGERYIKTHHGNNDKIKEIMEELKIELEKNKNRRETLKRNSIHKKYKDKKERIIKSSNRRF